MRKIHDAPETFAAHDLSGFCAACPAHVAAIPNGAIRARESAAKVALVVGDAAAEERLDLDAVMALAERGNGVLRHRLSGLHPARTDRSAVPCGPGPGRWTRSSAWTAAARDAQTAAEATADLRPRLGRARPLAEQSLGHPDAISLALCAGVVAGRP